MKIQFSPYIFGINSHKNIRKKPIAFTSVIDDTNTNQEEDQKITENIGLD